MAFSLSLCLLISCSGKKEGADTERAQSLRRTIGEHRASLESESATVSSKAATEKCKTALRAAAELRKLASKSKEPSVKDALKGMSDDLLAMSDVEQLAICRQKLKDTMSSFSHSGYQSGRDMMLKAIFTAFKLAVIAAPEFPAGNDDKDAARLSKSVNDAAEIARNTAEFLTRNKYSDDKDGRAKLVADLDAIAAKPPAEFNLLLSLAYLMSGSNDLALYEIESCNTATFQDTDYLSSKDKVLLYHIDRALVLHSMGWTPLADTEFAGLEKIMSDETETTPAADIQARNQTLSIWHLFLAYHFGYDKSDYIKMDQNLAWLIRLNPDSEIVVFLTGQKRGADGTLGNVEKSLEKKYAGTEDEQIIKVLAERIRAVRDSTKTEPPPRVITSPGFLLRLSYTLAKNFADRSPKIQELHRLLSSARNFWKVKKADEIK